MQPHIYCMLGSLCVLSAAGVVGLSAGMPRGAPVRLSVWSTVRVRHCVFAAAHLACLSACVCMCMCVCVCVQTREWYDKQLAAYKARLVSRRRELDRLRPLLKKLVVQLAYCR